MKCDFAMRPAHGIVAPRAFGFDARWTVKDRHTRLPTAQEVAEINAKHLISTPIKPADLLFVFGTREDVARRVEEAFRLWREGLFRWSIVSGGATPGSELSECEIIKAAMVARGIPPERILEERRATNTGENVIFSLPILEAALGLAIALRAARDGANVAIAAKTAEPHPKLEGTIYTAADEIRAAG